MGIGSILTRGAAAVATGGLSELGGARTVADAYHAAGGPDYMKQLGDTLGLSKPAALGTAAGEIAENDARRKQFADYLANYRDRTAPSVGSISLGPARQAEMPQMPSMQQAAGPQSFAAGAAQASPVANTGVGPVHQMTAATVGPAQQAQAGQAFAGNAQAQQIDTGGEVRNQQMGSLGALQMAANGVGPSAAEQQMQRGTAANIASQYAMARTAHGAGRVGALENAQGNAQAANADLVGRTGELRAAEQAQARNAYVQALQGVRGQDIGAQTTNAQLATDVNKFNVGTAADVSKANASEFGATTRFNAGQGNQMGLEGARFAQEAASQNMGAQNQANLTEAQIRAQQAQQNAAMGTDVSKYNAGATDAVNRFNEQNRQGNSQFNAQLEADRQKFAAGLEGQIGMFNTGQGNDMTRAQGTLDYQVGAKNVDLSTQWAQMDDNQKRAYMDFILGSQTASINGANALAGGEQAANNNRLAFVKTLANVGSAAAGKGAIG